MKYLIKKHKGIGLIEVLITTVVIAVGLMAVASLQGNLIGTSGENKTRSEAKMLCETKLEQLRDTVKKGVATSTTAGEYNAIGMVSPAVITTASGLRTGVTTENNITGVNETFKRVSTVKEVTDPVTGKEIDVNCSWGSGGADHQIIVQGFIAYEDLGATTIMARTDEPSSIPLGNPSTNANSSQVIYDKTNVAVVSGSENTLVDTTTTTGEYLKRNEGTNVTTASIVYRCTEETVGIPFIAFENGLYTRRIHNQALNINFKESIEVAKSNNDDLFGSGVHSCTRQIRYTGGIIIPIKGTIYSTTGNTYLLTASESGVYCAPSLVTAGSYSCYIGGNCTHGSVGTHQSIPNSTATIVTAGDDTTVFECPSHLTDITYSGSDPYPSGSYTTVGEGGWRGRIGFVGRITGNAQNDEVCLFDSSGTAVEYTARGYVSRWGSSTSARDFGINKPAFCQDFFIESCPPPSSVSLAQYNITRDFSASSGTVVIPVDLTADKSSCHVITGTVGPGETVTTSGGNFNCTVTGTNYECNGTSTSASVTVSSSAASCNLPTLTGSNTYGSSGTTLTCNLNGTAGTYLLTTNIGINGDSITPASGNQTANSAVTIGATASTGYQLSGWSVTGTGSTTCAGTTNPCSVTMGSDRVVTPIYELPTATYSLTTNANPATGGSITSPTSGTFYSSGTSVTITASSPNTGYTFSGWTVIGATANTCTGMTTPCSLTITSAASQSVTANFSLSNVTKTGSLSLFSGGKTTDVTSIKIGSTACSVLSKTEYQCTVPGGAATLTVIVSGGNSCSKTGYDISTTALPTINVTQTGTSVKVISCSL